MKRESAQKIKYIRAEKSQYYITKDEWKSFETTKSIKEGMIEETNQDKVISTHLRAKHNAGKGLILIEEFDKINNLLINAGLYPTLDGNGYGHAFEVFAVATLYHIDYNVVIENYLIRGDKDGGVDAIFFGEKNFFVYQIKLGVMKEDYKTRARDNIKEYRKNNKMFEDDASDLLEFCEKNKTKIKEKTPIYKCIGTTPNCDINTDEVINQYFEEQLLQGKKNNYNVKLEFYISPRKNASIEREERNFANYSDNEYFIFVEAKKLLQTINNNYSNRYSMERIFGDNVRGYGGRNQDMEKTVENEPKNFCLYNNGISIVGKCTLSDEILYVENPNVVNGQQTLLNLMNFEVKKLKDIYIPLFIKNVNPETKEVLHKIALYNNKQKTIKVQDLLTLKGNIRDIQEELYKNTDFYIELHSNTKKNSQDLVKRIYKKEDVIPMSEFLRAYSIAEGNIEIGPWKNSISKMLEKEFLEREEKLKLSIAKKACELVKETKKVEKTNKSIYSVASVGFIYILNKTDDIEVSKRVIATLVEKNANIDIANLFKKSDIKDLLDKTYDELCRDKDENAS